MKNIVYITFLGIFGFGISNAQENISPIYSCTSSMALSKVNIGQIVFYKKEPFELQDDKTSFHEINIEDFERHKHIDPIFDAKSYLENVKIDIHHHTYKEMAYFTTTITREIPGIEAVIETESIEAKLITDEQVFILLNSAIHPNNKYPEELYIQLTIMCQKNGFPSFHQIF